MMVADTQSPVIGRYGSASLSTYSSMCIGHVNIEIIFLCYTQSKSGWLFNTQSRKLPADWTRTVKTARRQFRTFSCPVLLTNDDEKFLSVVSTILC